MTGIAKSKSEAEFKIECLRKERRVDGQEQDKPDFVTSALNNTLEIISDQLYQNRSHFLLELIQNADDNAFPSKVTPTLSFTLSSVRGSQHLRTDCNEVGFTFQDMDSICGAGKSTKKHVTGAKRGYIGEKGIGFKSVFKVADVVNIASGYYEFKFDRHKFLGMVLPILSPFPSGQRLLNHTQFMLHLRGDEDFNKIQNDLHSVEPQLLIFLRKIRELNIQTSHIKTRYHVNSDASNAILGEIATISTQRSNGAVEERKYLVRRQDARGLPTDPRRQGVTTSEVVFAFPINNSDNTAISTQKAFAFLPIDDFGFKFLIHADFLLVASREGLNYDSTWNLALRDAIQQAFVTAIKRFVDMPKGQSGLGLRYGWPKYIKHHQHSQDFWNKLAQAILHDLRGQHILESRNECSYHRPNELRFLPTEFRYQGNAIFESFYLRQVHLSFNYDHVFDELSLLGVQQTSIEDLVDEFSIWIAEYGVSGLSARSMKWHQTVASLFSDQVQLKNTLSGLPIIPLRDGSWVSANTPNLYLRAETGDEYVPASIDISIVDEDASKDPVRRRFYQFLGIKIYTPKLVCNLILELHSGHPSSVANRTPGDLVMDAAYLFKHRNLLEREGAPQMYFLVKNQGNPSRRSSQIYVVDHASVPSLIDKYKDTPGNPFYILDEEYGDFYAGDEVTKRKFYKWLLQSEHISTVPILIQNHHLTAEWAFLQKRDVADLLLVVEQACKNSAIPPQLSQSVPELQVECRDGVGRRQPLANLAVPTKDLLRACPHIAFAKLPNPEKWKFLERFGIPATPNTTARLRELNALADLPIELVDKNAVHECYRGLSRSPEQHKRIILEMFMSKPLVFIVRPQPQWVKRSSCVWNAPAVLKQVTRLATRYSDCQKLFCDYLGVESANIKDVVDELCTIPEGPSEGIVQRCEELLTTLKGFLTLESEFTATQFLRVRHARVFPVLNAEHLTQPASESEVHLKSLQDLDWYIPDLLTLESAFRGKVDLLKFSVKSVTGLKSVFSKLRCQNLYLSSVVEETVMPQGLEVRDLMREQDLMTRLPYISSLETMAGARSSQNSRTIRAWSVPSVVITRCLDSIEIEEDNELVTFKEEPFFTDIYFRAVITPSNQPDVIFKLADFFSQQYAVKSEDMNLFILLLNTPLDNLNSTMAQHNRFIPDGGMLDYKSSNQRGVNQQESEPMDLVRDQHSELSERVQEDPDCIMITTEATEPIQMPVSSPSINFQHLLRQLVPSFESRSQSIANSARNFRISKHHIVRGSENARRIERLQQMLDSALGGSTSSIISQPTERGLPASVAGSGENDEPSLELPVAPSAQQVRTREIGFLGEVFIHKLFENQISGWSHEQWTSKLRVENGHPRFTELERNFADFTYTDDSGQMKAYFQNAGVDQATRWSNSTTYHLEVKTTTGSCNQPFFVSQNQVNMMRKFDKDPGNAYILLRVFDVDGDSPGLKIYPSPWGLGLTGILGFSAPGGYEVLEVRQLPL
ncbi:hypothetical protein EDB80DRAFT_607184 [Ilyonectria destructans]|nr:hypothetical protein EDB80DRAFT_607184 [Ilyonectria destructans]